MSRASPLYRRCCQWSLRRQTAHSCKLALTKRLSVDLIRCDRRAGASCMLQFSWHLYGRRARSALIRSVRTSVDHGRAHTLLQHTLSQRAHIHVHGQDFTHVYVIVGGRGAAVRIKH